MNFINYHDLSYLNPKNHIQSKQINHKQNTLKMHIIQKHKQEDKLELKGML